MALPPTTQGLKGIITGGVETKPFVIDLKEPPVKPGAGQGAQIQQGTLNIWERMANMFRDGETVQTPNAPKQGIALGGVGLVLPFVVGAMAVWWVWKKL